MKLIVRPALLDHHVLAFYEPRLVQTLAERHHDIRERLSRCAAEKSDHRHPLGLLGAHRERPRGCPAAKKHDESAATAHSITLSARNRNDSGIVRPSVLAVLRLMTSSYLDACSTGRSAGLTPLRILST
jgi:hypothetical protein